MSGSQRVKAETNRLISILAMETKEAKEFKARLRHSAALQPGEDAMLWGWLLSKFNLELDTLKRLRDGDVSFDEYAVYIALTMFAIGPKNSEENSLAEAVALGEIKKNRLVSAEIAVDMKDMQTELRGLVKLIASKGISFNYGELAKDLYSWQFNKTEIALKWEREYALTVRRNENRIQNENVTSKEGEKE